ncbi:hypothetical protein UPYG_G00248350 [Umbra pygmaea]|uniref:Interleukin-1 receptor-associated kinase 1-binding protein 1 n=1 Tax=Umbra pygmaea TaxID=75934 RepID=A0ABD0W727_UMBPY
MASPSRVFAALLPAAEDVYREENEPGMGRYRGTIQRNIQRTQNTAREVHVTGSAEISCAADRATLSVSVTNSKETVNDVTNSISRRVEYILQTLRQHDVKEEDVTVRRHIYRAEDLFTIDAQVTAVFSDFVKMDSVCVVLLEKLSHSVCVSKPQYYHSQECLSLLRRRVCVAAVENARLKASEVCSLLGQTLGLPLQVTEEEATETRTEGSVDGRIEGEEGGREGGRQPSLTATCRVFVTFNLRLKDKTRKRL